MKATLITTSNRAGLCQRYGADLDEFEIGYYLIAEFGDNGQFRHQGLLTLAELDAHFTQGEALDNGFFEIKRKPVTRFEYEAHGEVSETNYPLYYFEMMNREYDTNPWNYYPAEGTVTTLFVNGVDIGQRVFTAIDLYGEIKWVGESNKMQINYTDLNGVDHRGYLDQFKGTIVTVNW